jgi:hypothetical protein
MRPCLTVNRYWSRPERPVPNTQPHPEIQDPNNGNKVWARISSALVSAIAQVGLSLKDLGNLGTLNITFDGQNLSSPFQDTLNISMYK